MPGIGRATVAILGFDSPVPNGTGFLVGKREVLTCAHVVGDALGDPMAIAKNEAPPDGPLRVRFSVTERPTFITARVIHWGRYFERLELAADENAARYPTRDLAVLQLEEDPPEGAKPVRFWIPADPTLLDRILKDRRLVAAGYPKIGSDAYHSLEFAYDSLTDGEELMVRQMDTDFDEDDLSGLSGAGLVLKDFGLVIGLVMEVGTTRHLVVAKPAHQLEQFWKDVRVVFHGFELDKLRKVPDQLLPEIDRSNHCTEISRAALEIQETGPGVMMAGILGRNENRIHEWIDYLVSQVIQPKLRIRLGEWVAPPQAINIARIGRRLSVDDVLWKALDDLAQKLGIRHTASEGDEFVSAVRGVLNEEDVGAPNRTEPPPYFNFQFSAHKFGDGEIQVLERMIRFWNDVAKAHLDRIHLVFFTLVSKTAEEANPSLNLEKICTAMKNSFHAYRAFHIIDPVPGVRMDDIIMWIRDYEDDLDDLWKLDAATAHRYRQVVRDIFKYEADGEELSLSGFQKELDNLELCRKYQEV